jgi:pimeloyl-ACP methyl ester carboxylesterase
LKEYLLTNVNARLRYHDLNGDQIPILFIHGLGCASSFDYPQVAAMRALQSHRRILIDLLGSGFSDRPEDFGYTIDEHARYLEGFVDSLELRECILYAHSMGGSIAISLANRLVGTVKGIVISEANLDSGGGFFSKKIAAYAEKDYVSFGHQKVISESLSESDRNWALCLSMSSAAAVHRESVSLVAGASPSWREILYSLKCTRTYIFGEMSLPDPDFEKLKNRNINIKVVQRAGHSMAWENPEGLAAAIQKGIGLATLTDLTHSDKRA